MNNTSITIAAGGIATAGQWSKGQALSPKFIVATGFLAASVALISTINDNLGQKFAYLLLITAALYYGVPLLDKMGLLNSTTATPAPQPQKHRRGKI